MLSLFKKTLWCTWEWKRRDAEPGRNQGTHGDAHLLCPPRKWTGTWRGGGARDREGLSHSDGRSPKIAEGLLKNTDLECEILIVGTSARSILKMPARPVVCVGGGKRMEKRDRVSLPG